MTILGPTNLPSTVPYHASQMYAKNITTFLLHLIKDGACRRRSAGRNHARDADCGKRRCREREDSRGPWIAGPCVGAGLVAVRVLHSRRSASASTAAAPTRPAVGFKITRTGIRRIRSSSGAFAQEGFSKSGHLSAGRILGAIPPPRYTPAVASEQRQVSRRGTVDRHEQLEHSPAVDARTVERRARNERGKHIGAHGRDSQGGAFVGIHVSKNGHEARSRQHLLELRAPEFTYQCRLKSDFVGCASRKVRVASFRRLRHESSVDAREKCDRPAPCQRRSAPRRLTCRSAQLLPEAPRFHPRAAPGLTTPALPGR